ncbi:type VI secretion system-associated FHA domain protein TagH [Paraburkholderia sediminicola]|uniref:Type VI secretion system-associated FHA domain protein TagH n=1 Tax=Paraburkholderia rhynchosiae TaxID=487049 RepID=A0ACC7N6B4_9BURK
MNTLAYHFAPGAPGHDDPQPGSRMTLEVRSYQGTLLAAPLARCFDAAGGAIGRGPDNALVLPDALKTVSRVQARVDCADGAWWLTDLGSNPSRLNGRPVTAHARSQLADRDRLEMGAYVLDVTIEALAVAPASNASHDAEGVFALTDPDHAADLLGGVPPFATDALLGDPLAQAAVLAGARLPGAPFDPLGAPLRQSVQAADGRAAFAGSEHDHVSPEQFAFVPPEMAHGVQSALSIPDDYDPLNDAALGRHARSHGEGGADAVAPRTVASTVVAQSAAAASSDLTLAALLDGLGLDRSAVRERSGADVARLAGRMLRTAVSGTVNVLLSRSVLKREVRLDTTLLLQRDNNPLKFFPDGDSALQQMLSGRGSGYLPAEAALQRAFEDIRGHELAVLAGMRAALQHVLGRFDPHVLSAASEAQDARGWLGKLPGRRKAQLWDQFTALYSELARASDDDLQALCGSAFNDAYERQAGLLRDGQPLTSTHSQRDDNVHE